MGFFPPSGANCGKPTFARLRRLEGDILAEKKEKIGIEKHIRIADNEINNQIERVMKLPEYKSFNQVVNDALFYGLPILCEKLFGVVQEQKDTAPPLQRQSFGGIDEKSFNVLVRLLKETVLNVTINKSILSSLFHGKCLEYKGCKVNAENFEQGLTSDTPDYLSDYELNGLKKMRR